MSGRRVPLLSNPTPGLRRRGFLAGAAALALGGLLPGLGGCATRGWRTFRAKGLPKQDFHANTLFFADARTGFLGGMLNDWNTLCEPGLFTTRDGGLSWRRLELPASRLGVEHILVHAGEIFLVLGDLSAPGVLLRSRDGGGTWEDVFGPDAGMSVRASSQVVVTSEGDIRLTATRKDGSEALLTRKAGRNDWAETPLPSIKNGWTRLGPSGPLLLTWNRDGGIAEVTYLDDGVTVSLPPSLRRPRLVPSSGRFWWMCGRDETSGMLHMYRITPEGCLPAGPPFGKDVQLLTGLTACNDTVCCMVITGSSIFGASHVLYVSRDAGATWTPTNPSNTMIVEPAFQYRDEFYLMDNGLNEFARLDFAALGG